jgi:hypothetical protein
MSAKRIKQDEFTGKRMQNEAIKQIQYEKLIAMCKKDSPILENTKRKGWQRYIYRPKGGVSIRCQARSGNKSTGKVVQCLMPALIGKLVCRRHGGALGKANTKKVKIREELGIYSGNGIKNLQAELKEIQDLQPEQLQDTTDELKLSIALLRKYLKSADDEKIAKNPSQLLWMIGEIARLKKEYYEIKHTKNVSFTKEQVVFLFNQFYLILIKLVKDTDLLQQISYEIEQVGNKIGESGFKSVN